MLNYDSPKFADQVLAVLQTQIARDVSDFLDSWLAKKKGIKCSSETIA